MTLIHEGGKQAPPGEIQRGLAHLDLYNQSLRLLGEKLVSRSINASTASGGVLHERSLLLAGDCSATLSILKEHLNPQDIGSWESTHSRVDLAVHRASQADDQTQLLVNVWRLVEAVEQFLDTVGPTYGYTTLARRGGEGRGSTLEDAVVPVARGFGRHERAMASETGGPKPLPIPRFALSSRWRGGRFVRPGLLLGTAIILGFIAIALAAPILAPPEGDDPYTMPKAGYRVQPEPPRPGHPLGTTEQSFDVFHGMVWGTHIAFRIGLSVTIGRAIIGLIVGLIAGYYGGWLDAIVMRVTDGFLAFPIVPATLVMLAFFGPGPVVRTGERSGLDFIVILALILFGWMQYARLVRGNVLLERAKQYVEAATALGARNLHIIRRHILPNVSQGLFVLIASDIGAMVVLAAVFTFLGLSGRRGLADWGYMLNIGRNWIIGTPSSAFQYWYVYLPPIAAIVLFSVGWNLIGDGLRDALDPRSQ